MAFRRHKHKSGSPHNPTPINPMRHHWKHIPVSTGSTSSPTNNGTVNSVNPTHGSSGGSANLPTSLAGSAGGAYTPFVQLGVFPDQQIRPSDMSSALTNTQLEQAGFTKAKNNLTGDTVWVGPLAINETYTSSDGSVGPLFTPDTSDPQAAARQAAQAAAAQAALGAPGATDPSWYAKAGGALATGPGSSDPSGTQSVTHPGSGNPSNPINQNPNGQLPAATINAAATIGAATDASVYSSYAAAGVSPSDAYAVWDQNEGYAVNSFATSPAGTVQNLLNQGFAWVKDKTTGDVFLAGPLAASNPEFIPISGPPSGAGAPSTGVQSNMMSGGSAGGASLPSNMTYNLSGTYVPPPTNSYNPPTHSGNQVVVGSGGLDTNSQTKHSSAMGWGGAQAAPSASDPAAPNNILADPTKKKLDTDPTHLKPF